MTVPTTPVPRPTASTAPSSAAPIVRGSWRRGRLWLALAAIVAVAAAVVTATSGGSGRPLDPNSPSKGGSKALAVLLRHYGASVRTGDSVAGTATTTAHAVVVVTAPDDYSSAQLRTLRDSAGLLVLIAPGRRAATAVLPGAEPTSLTGADAEPDCSDPGAQATGKVDSPGDARTYARGAGTDRCYGGLLINGPKAVILGSAALLRNDHLAGRGVAALDVNVLTAQRRIDTVRWLLPGSDAAGSGPTTIWALFPTGVHRAFWWLLAVAALLVLWRARRFGRVVTEPLPLVVRAAEVVEGHGRLYQRAAARDRAAAALRAATLRRLAQRLALPPSADAAMVAAAVVDQASLWQRSADHTHHLLAGGTGGTANTVADDEQLLLLARELDELTDAVQAAPGERSPRT